MLPRHAVLCVFSADRPGCVFNDEPGVCRGSKEEHARADCSRAMEAASGGDGGRKFGKHVVVRSMIIRSPLGDWIGSSIAVSIVSSSDCALSEVVPLLRLVVLFIYAAQGSPREEATVWCWRAAATF